jgi:hypothetical protein
VAAGVVSLAAGAATASAATITSDPARSPADGLTRAGVARGAGTTTLRLKPSRRSRAAIRRLKRIRVTVRVTFRPATGAAAGTSQRAVTVSRSSR